MLSVVEERFMTQATGSENWSSKKQAIINENFSLEMHALTIKLRIEENFYEHILHFNFFTIEILYFLLLILIAVLIL